MCEAWSTSLRPEDGEEIGVNDPPLWAKPLFQSCLALYGSLSYQVARASQVDPVVALD